MGLSGRVLETGRPAWIADVTKDQNFPRAKVAGNIGVKAAFAFPVDFEETTGAVLEFFSNQVEEPHVRLLNVMGTIGTQLARVIE